MYRGLAAVGVAGVGGLVAATLVALRVGGEERGIDVRRTLSGGVSGMGLLRLHGGRLVCKVGKTALPRSASDTHGYVFA